MYALDAQALQLAQRLLVSWGYCGQLITQVSPRHSHDLGHILLCAEQRRRPAICALPADVAATASHAQREA